MSAFALVFLILGMAILAVTGRLIMGPTIPDRVVALDTINTLVVAAMIILGAIFDSIVMVDIAIVYAALSFVGTLFIARHVEGGF
ncbi:MAG: monovalent cation/H+ antiporter complex subunit F [Acetomicrobium sp.]|jgi:multicomponent Na+:H+ antiporter subunit F|uniref:monovalent cation/H+ antiporter complex subunit F n=2 Tax=Acetomicrobium TaxID=49894 RepID=UPI0016B3549D|nr:monovalent cation/H+ antiporter complex subunit F [Acetomicrobium sp.]MDI9376812.1 monovalent cation/H+ antiporter complex subunit F [Synergistota bacterium]NLI43078.1 cation:proton antiporter [Synergistaceae bacterium]MDR9769158.1 monovalent cation/H+ antiporter complex subunit F [Acetomicrobium sp.]HOB10396.1 monovalent cation/H+ antiporter complex subunit F [Acetomicrobium sp.]HOM97551.1 monovalent cation/H+ antiporter complex subunit F [Acetomicrobium sp.]